MKVDVLQFEQATFRSWTWWSNWVDICLFDYDHDGFLLQMSVSRSNKKKFRHIGFKSVIAMNLAHAAISETGNLTQMKGDQHELSPAS